MENKTIVHLLIKRHFLKSDRPQRGCYFKANSEKTEVLDNFKLKDLIYLALRDAANNLKACFYTEECDIEAIDDILHSLQTVIGHNIFCLETVKNIDVFVF